MIAAESRLPGLRRLIDRMGYAVVHAPRQTGKTTTLKALTDALNQEAQYAAVHFSCEPAKVAREDYGEAEQILLAHLRRRAEHQLAGELRPPEWPVTEAGEQLHAALAAWAAACPKPLVLVFDEIDALRGRSLESVLGQLRAGYDMRPERAPWSVVLCGLRDVRDYRLHGGSDDRLAGSSSPFNIKVKSVRIADFDEDELRALYAQHTSETGQPFTDDALRRAWELTRGQPWLANAVGAEVTDELGIAPPEAITEEHVELAKERIILARQTHLDSLVARLHEPRVRRIIEPLLAGSHPGGDAYDDDLQFVRDLGLLTRDRPVRVANPIYREVIVRALAATVVGSAAEAAVQRG